MKLDLFAVAILNWYPARESNPSLRLERPLFLTDKLAGYKFGRGYWVRTSDNRVKVCGVTATLTPNIFLIVKCVLQPSQGLIFSSHYAILKHANDLISQAGSVCQHVLE